MTPKPRRAPAAIEPLLTVNDVVGILKCDRRTLERLRASGRFPSPALVIGRSPRWHTADIRAWIEQGGGAR